MIIFIILSFLEIVAERRQKFISVEFNFAIVFASKHRVSRLAQCARNKMLSHEVLTQSDFKLQSVVLAPDVTQIFCPACVLFFHT
jgi:hypothetical protein